MKLTLIQVATFSAKFKKLRLTDEDLQALEQQIMENPEAGDVVVGTGGMRKIRFAPPSWNTGKSGATRVCYALFATIDTVYLLTLFAKNEQGNLTADEKAAIKAWMTQTRKWIRE
jgi:hypothetical protein